MSLLPLALQHVDCQILRPHREVLSMLPITFNYNIALPTHLQTGCSKQLFTVCVTGLIIWSVETWKPFSHWCCMCVGDKILFRHCSSNLIIYWLILLLYRAAWHNNDRIPLISLFLITKMSTKCGTLLWQIKNNGIDVTSGINVPHLLFINRFISCYWLVIR